MSRRSARLWWRWSVRDLRRHWLLVTALALVISIGTGAYAGLGGTTAWRLASNDASYTSLRMHDLRLQLPEGGFVRTGTLAAVVQGTAGVATAEERLVVPTQVDASYGGRTVLVPGELVGAPSEAMVDVVHRVAGAGVAAGAVLEAKFAADHGLPDRGTVAVSGGRTVRYVGTGYGPEYFRIVGRVGSMLGETGFAVLFVPLASAQALSGHPGTVNDLVLRLAPGADRAAVQAQLVRAATAFGATVTTRDDDPVRRGLYADARNDQKTWNMLALLILLGAAFAAFNLVTRMVDAQRRELGVGMALGVSPRLLALRPLLVGVQVAVLGVAAGIGVGWLMALAMRHEMAVLLPMPVWLTPFQTGRFLQAAALGLAIPLLATVLPLRRVLRLQPVDAIRTGAYGSGSRSRLTALVRDLKLPGRSYLSMPLRNVARAPRRTALTALGVAAALTCMVTVLGLLDTFQATGRRSAAELERVNPDRLTVTLAALQPEGSPVVRGIAAAPGVGAVQPQLRLRTELVNGDKELESVTEVLDLRSGVWAPTISSGDLPAAADGIVLSEKAARDLGVDVGDTIQVRHPVRTPTGFRLATTTLRVSGLHPSPLRPFSYVDRSRAGLLGAAGVTNELVVVPAAGTTQDAVLRELFGRDGVTAVEAATSFSKMLDYRLGQFTGILRVIEIAALLLALLIAFNTASLAADERAREHATMFAFGLPGRTVTAMAMAENALIGLAGTAVGVGLGYLALRWIVAGFESVLPDLAVDPTIFGSTITATLALGVAAVALAPLLNVRKQHRMDVPSTLRVVE